MVSGAIGERVAAYRRRRGISQTALAGLVGRSESWLSQVERGIRSIDSLTVILDLSRVLRVEPEKLISRPWRYAPNGDPTEPGLEPIRRFFTCYEDLLHEGDWSVIDLTGLRKSVGEAHRRYQGADYEQVIGQLPSMLTAADHAVRSAVGAAERDLALDYVSSYVVTAKLLTKLGATDLALIVADRAATKAIEAESEVARGMAAYQVVCALSRADRSDDAEHLAVGMAEQLQRGARADKQSLVSLGGALWLIASVIAARRMDRDEAWTRLDRAEHLAGLLGHDGNYAWTAFGPTNVALHRVSVATSRRTIPLPAPCLEQ